MATSAEPLPLTDAGQARPPGVFTSRWIQGIEYFHSQPVVGGDSFSTRYGLPFAGDLQPENWFEPEWFTARRRRLRGTKPAPIFVRFTKDDALLRRKDGLLDNALIDYELIEKI